MAAVYFTPGKEISSATGAEEKLRILEDRINNLQQDLEYILNNLDDSNMAASKEYILPET